MSRFAPTLWAVLVLLVSTPPIAAAYSGPWAIGVLAACVVGPFVVVACGRLLRVPRWAVATAGLVVGVLVALVFADDTSAEGARLAPWRSSPGFTALGPLIDAVPRLLTAPRPAPFDPSLLVPAGLFVWVVALVVALAVVGRERAGVAPLLGAVVLQVAGALLTAGDGDVVGISALATAFVVLVGWVLLPVDGPRTTTSGGSGRERGSRRGRGVLLPALVAVVVATSALAATLVVPRGEGFEPRALVAPPQLPVETTNPVPEAAAWAQAGDVPLLTVEPVAGEVPERLALVVLPDYTGVAWTLEAHLRGVGVVAEPDTAPGLAHRTVTYTVAADRYAEAWLPAAGAVRSVDRPDALLDVDSGTLVAAGGWDAEQDAVTITSVVDVAAPDALARASVPPTADVARYLELPRAPGVFAEAAQLVTAGVSNRWEQVLLLADAVREDTLREGASGAERTLDHGARSGSSYARLQQFLLAAPEDGGQVGTHEQFAASFAVLARTLGIPTRLVVGFEVPQDGGPGPVQVTGSDSRVWAEVYLARVGWVPVDPSPGSSITTQLPSPAPVDGGDTGEERRPVASDDSEHAVVREPAEPAAPDRDLTTVVLVALATLATLVLVALALGVARAVRRRRWRTAGEPGAWAQVEDAVRLAGLPRPRGRTAPDVARSMPEPVRDTALLVAERAERSAYAPGGGPGSGDGPGSGGVPGDGGPGDDGATWALTRRVEAGLRRAAPLRRRLVWWSSPRVWRR